MDTTSNSPHSDPNHQGPTKLSATHQPSDDATIALPSNHVSLAKTQDFGEYELLAEIARGGMGVVYKAKQKKLNRTVAIKMILAGDLAGDEEIGRFYNEAESAAHLQHPNIVAIHDVGKIDNQHYFSMDFVDGQSLKEVIQSGELEIPQAVQYVKQISEAIAYAHQQGILHRDLKPHNVLIDPHDQPQVTDFGIAKRVEVNSELTSTGAVLGTPSYMSPEQACAKKLIIGPQSDVYSIGAILFECLTGQPPFTGANTIDTLLRVLEEEPPSLRKMNSAIPKDLETICLKCLGKTPQERYATAQELADDLQRFQHNEPILAKPLGPIGKLNRWARYKPFLAISLLACAVLITFHFLSMFVFRADEELFLFTWGVAGLFLLWTGMSFYIQRMLDRPKTRLWGCYLYAIGSTVLFVAACTADKAALSAPIAVCYVNLAIIGLMSQNTKVVWTGLAISVLGYFWMMAFGYWIRPEFQVPSNVAAAFLAPLCVMAVVVNLLITRIKTVETKLSERL